MNTKTFLPLVCMLFATTPSFSEILSPEQALSRVKPGYNLTATRSGEADVKLNYTLKGSDDNAALYVFNRQNAGGYLVVSADSRTPALLGYTDSGAFDSSDIPPQLQYWLKEYSRQIDYIRTNSEVAQTSEQSSTLPSEAIQPLLKSKWNQGAPFNLDCYTIAADGTQTKSVTGCVATAMAQVMYYFQYPDIGHGDISYKHGDSGTYSMNFGDQAFEWNEMLPVYYPDSYTSEQADAVAYLMKACGYSVKMDYGKGESGANGANIGEALINYFGYNPNIVLATRKFYTYTDWVQMIYKNLSEVGPVVYDGFALDGGHSFVCDGYDGNGYFHFNWGWGGMSDGYYLLDALNPDEYGIGGAAGGYNLNQQVILGISTESKDIFPHAVYQFGALTGKLDGSTLSFEIIDPDGANFQYIDPMKVTVTFGFQVYNTTNTGQTVQYVESSKKNIEATESTSFKWDEVGTTINLDELEMTVGDSYDLVLSTLITASDGSQWVETLNMPGKSNKVTVTKTSSGYEITNYSSASLQVSDFKVLNTTIYQNLPVKFSATFTNASNDDLTRNYSVVFFDSAGKECYKMENYSVNVDADTTIDTEWTSVQWYKENDATDITEETQYTLKLYDNWTGQYVDGIEETVTVSPQPKDSKVEATLSVVGATMDGDVYVVNGTSFEASITIKVTEGYFNGTVNLGIEAPLSDGKYYTLMHRHFDAIPDLSAGEEQTLTMEMELEDAEPGKIYHLQAWSSDADFGKPVDIRFNISDSGVNVIPTDSSGEYNVYNLSGIKVLTTKDATELYSLPSGIYIVNGHKIAL